MAQGLLRHLLEKKGRTDVQVLSAGVGTAGGMGPTPETVEVMEREGIDVSGHIGQPLTPTLVARADALFCMEEFHREAILRQAPEAAGKVHLLREFQAKQPPVNPNIPDPIGLPKEIYESCFFTIQEAVGRVARWLEENQ
ncbi:MAG: hypothetical protein HYZ93_05940 [Candidatus Omnitrophica bacterium]|nr:hypothetical protein [Candidatus Omnitrophota bacterium]